jgi:hypothetical protein
MNDNANANANANDNHVVVVIQILWKDVIAQLGLEDPCCVR